MRTFRTAALLTTLTAALWGCGEAADDQGASAYGATTDGEKDGTGGGSGSGQGSTKQPPTDCREVCKVDASGQQKCVTICGTMPPPAPCKEGANCTPPPAPAPVPPTCAAGEKCAPPADPCISACSVLKNDPEKFKACLAACPNQPPPVDPCLEQCAPLKADVLKYKACVSACRPPAPPPCKDGANCTPPPPCTGEKCPPAPSPNPTPIVCPACDALKGQAGWKECLLQNKCI
ncbi:MAG: hypothetical protein IT371_09360 [Deltaproteobacteria bacterium]|nr:hypothetical protein [Deltaproteobacteria bacterium]